MNDTTYSDERVARAYLSQLAEPPAPTLAAFVAECGAVETAARVRAGSVPAAVREEISVGLNRMHVDLASAATVGARLVFPEDDEWPTQLAALGDQLPIALWVRGTGRLDDLLDRAVTIAGSRACTAYGEHVAADFGYHLAEHHVTVVSGGSYGVDAAAVRGACSAGGPTVAIVACGVDVAYPNGNAALLNRVADGGLLVSEYPPGTPPAQHRFVRRAVLLGAATAGTVVVEASVRSGARTVAGSAATVGRAVMAVPGPITSVMSTGAHELLRAGTAIPVASVTEILETTFATNAS